MTIRPKGSIPGKCCRSANFQGSSPVPGLKGDSAVKAIRHTIGLAVSNGNVS